MLIKCEKCFIRKAVWYYMPSDSIGYLCDECVSRGCSCNEDPETHEEYRDDKNRLLPCCEYDYNENGYTNDD
jgi:hypothetical protein